MALLRRNAPAGLRIFFATDIHGSEVCFRKFLNAGTFYDATCLVLGGDITGKLMVPILEEAPGRYSARYGEESHLDLDASGLRDLTGHIRRFGHYPIVGTRDELDELEDPARRDEAFRKLVYDVVADWVALGEERLRGSGRRCFMAPGNDDFFEIDSALQGSDTIEFAEGRCLPLDEHHEMITTGYSNPTPWDTEREMTEERLEQHIWSMALDVTDSEALVAVLHPPPFDSGIDLAPKLDPDLRMSADAAGVAMAPVGSTAVRAFVEQRQPLLGLHGHVHEGRGAVKVGRTLCVNPGSEYTEGVLAGALVTLRPHEVASHQFVSG